MAGNTFKGWASDTDPRYKGGSTISTGANLNPNFVRKSLRRSKSQAQPQTPAKEELPNQAPLPEESEKT
jgi:hypothetical protein